MRVAILLGLWVALVALTGCASNVPPSAISNVPNAPVRMTVSDPIAGIAQILTADVQQSVSDLIAAGAGTQNGPIALTDSLTCGQWLLTAIPQAQAMTSGAIPTFQAKGAYSAFIEGKIAVYHIKGLVGGAQTQFIDVFNHNCGAAIAGDVNAINQLLLKVGISVVPGGGVASGILGGILPVLP